MPSVVSVSGRQRMQGRRILCPNMGTGDRHNHWPVSSVPSLTRADPQLARTLGWADQMRHITGAWRLTITQLQTLPLTTQFLLRTNYIICSYRVSPSFFAHCLILDSVLEIKNDPLLISLLHLLGLGICTRNTLYSYIHMVVQLVFLDINKW